MNMFSLKCLLNINVEMQGRQWGLETEKLASQQQWGSVDGQALGELVHPGSDVLSGFSRV